MKAGRFVQHLSASRDAAAPGWQQLVEVFLASANEAGAFRPEGVTYHTRLVQQVPVDVFTPPSAQGAVLLLHGGNYLLPVVDAYRNVARDIALATGKTVVLPDYAVAPYRYPEALGEVLTVWEWMYAQDDRICLVGDGSGANLALSLSLFLAGEDVRMPACMALLSPQVDMTCSGHSYYDNYYLDVLYGQKHLAGQDIPDAFKASPMWAYCRGYDLSSPEISPLFADLAHMPPMHIVVGSHEVVLSDARALAAKAREAGVSVTLTEGEGLFYAYPYFHRQFEEARTAFADMCGFIRQF